MRVTSGSVSGVILSRCRRGVVHDQPCVRCSCVAFRRVMCECIRCSRAVHTHTHIHTHITFLTSRDTGVVVALIALLVSRPTCLLTLALLTRRVAREQPCVRCSRAASRILGVTSCVISHACDVVVAPVASLALRPTRLYSYTGRMLLWEQQCQATSRTNIVPQHQK